MRLFVTRNPDEANESRFCTVAAHLAIVSPETARRLETFMSGQLGVISQHRIH